MDVFELVAGAQRDYLRDAVVHAAHRLRDAAPTRRLRKLHEAMAVLGIDPAALPPDRPMASGGWGSLAEAIRADRPLPEDPGSLAAFHAHLHEIGEEPARELWRRLAPLRGPLLDLGGGTGAYTKAFLAQFPGETAILADRPEVLALAHVPARAALLPLDLLNMQPPGGQGIVLLANVLHLFGRPQIEHIVRRAEAALGPGGMLVIKDLRSDTEEGVLFALNMALYTEAGDVHPLEILEQSLRVAGLRDVRRSALESSPKSLVLTASKP